MQYGKLTDGALLLAPNPLPHNGFKVYNPSGAACTQAGYVPIEETPYPDDGLYYTAGWEQQGERIVQVWTQTDPPTEQETATAIELTPTRLREQAYDNEPRVLWDGRMLTVTQAAQQWAYYAAEGDEDKTGALTVLIAQAKRDIRAQYPDDMG